MALEALEERAQVREPVPGEGPAEVALAQAALQAEAEVTHPLLQRVRAHRAARVQPILAQR